MKLLLIYVEVPETVKLYVFDTEAGYSVEELQRMGRCNNMFVNSDENDDILWLYDFIEGAPSITLKDGEPYRPPTKTPYDMVVVSGIYI